VNTSFSDKECYHVYTTSTHRVASDQYIAVNVVTKGSRRHARYLLRALVREVTSLGRRVESCGMPLGVSDVALKMNAERVAHYSGLMTCGNIWVCPVCSAKIRAERAAEISEGLRYLITELGGGGLFCSLTMSHAADDELTRTVGLVSDGFRAVQSSRAYVGEREKYGILGHIRAFEVTHGVNGWHPHLHTVMCLRGRATAQAAAELQDSMLVRWNRWFARNNWPLAAPGIGVKIKVVRTLDDLAQYMTKVQEGSLGRYQATTYAGWEMARSDMKLAREHTSRTPFEIFADYGNTGLVEYLDRWHEYEQGMKGRSAIRWSPGLRGLLLPGRVELSDEEVAATEQEGVTVALISHSLWRLLERHRGLSAELLDAVERGGFSEILALLTKRGVPTDGLLRPEPRA
jgi:hypothetical protein